MSWFGTEGQKLERKEKWKEAAEWYEKQGQSLNALRCWKAHYGSSKEYARCLERHGEYIRAAECFLENDASYSAMECYEAVGAYKQGGQTLLKSAYSGDKCYAHSYRADAARLLVKGKLYKEAIETLLLIQMEHPTYYHDDEILNIFKLVGQESPKEAFILFLKEYWDRFATGCYTGRDAPITFMFYPEIFEIIDMLNTDPFVNCIVHSFIKYFIQTEYLSPPGSKQKIGWTLRGYSKWLRDHHPNLAVDYCVICLNNKYFPLPYENRGEWKEAETIWLSELSKAYFANNEMEKAIEVYSSRYRFGEAAEVLEELGRIDEAITLLEQSGAANYRTRDTSWDKQLIDPLVRERFWREKIAQLKGRIAATKHLNKSEEKPPRPSLDDLDKMLALGEITAEEYEKMKSHSEDGKAQEENLKSKKCD